MRGDGTAAALRHFATSLIASINFLMSCSRSFSSRFSPWSLCSSIFRISASGTKAPPAASHMMDIMEVSPVTTAKADVYAAGSR